VTETSRPAIRVVVVTFESARVIDACLDALAAAAPRRGVDVRVIDNGSSDDGARRAEHRLGIGHVVRLESNRGFAAGVNAGLRDATTPFVAVVNPDVVLPASGLDVLADALDAEPRAGLVGPRVRDVAGRPDRSAGHFPTLGRERVHAWCLDRLLGRVGRRMDFPSERSRVDWLSGCMWLLRTEAIRDVGPLDEDYFMYFEDVDYCRRLAAASWAVIAVPAVEVRHAIAQGSARSVDLPADGGAKPLLHYFEKFHPDTAPAAVRGTLTTGWRLRRLFYELRARAGYPAARARAHRFELALASLRETGKERGD
jgi:N-acetylglucosaminyl-diphospho-decaprenol L-rhamnosyltransferase